MIIAAFVKIQKLLLVISMGLPLIDYAMEKPDYQYEKSESSWKHQNVVTLTLIDDYLQSSIIFFVPKIPTMVPMIGFASCSCHKFEGLTDDPVHRQNMVDMFKKVLKILARKGFRTVKFSAKLLDAPECLATFIRNTHEVPVISQEGTEITTFTRLNP